MLGYIITYKAHDTKSRTLLNHRLFGRIVHQTYRGRKYAYYIRGLLHDVPFARLVDSKIFLENANDVPFGILKDLGTIEILKGYRDESRLVFQTGREYWENIAKEKNFVLKIQRKDRYGYGE